MDKEFDILVVIEIKRSVRKAVEWTLTRHPDRLFLDLPSAWQPILDRAAIEPHERVLEEMREFGVVKEPQDDHLIRCYAPIWDALHSFRRNGIQLVCYLDDQRHLSSSELAAELAAMTLRARLGKIDPELWRSIILEELSMEPAFSRAEASNILGKAGDLNTCLNASEDVRNCLMEGGFKINEILIDKPCKPLDMLRRRLREELMTGTKVSGEEVVSLVRDHVRFTDMVLMRDFDYAYHVWIESHYIGSLD